MAERTRSRRSAKRWNSSTRTPGAGRPRLRSRTWVESRAKLISSIASPQRQTNAAERRPRVGIYAERFRFFRDGIPRPVISFQIHFGYTRNLSQHFLSKLLDDLLDAARFEIVEDSMYQG